MAREIHQVGRILAIMDGECGIESDPPGIFAQESRADAMEGTGPAESAADQPGMTWRYLAGDALDTSRHLVGGTPREGQQQDAVGIGAVRQQMGDTVSQGIGFSGAGSGNNQQRITGLIRIKAISRGVALVVIEAAKVVRNCLGG